MVKVGRIVRVECMQESMQESKCNALTDVNNLKVSFI